MLAQRQEVDSSREIVTFQPQPEPSRLVRNAVPTDNTKFRFQQPLSDEDFLSLKASIAQRGIEVPIVMDEAGNVLDGFYRLQAATELKRDGTTVDYMAIIKPGLTDHEKRSLVRTLNLHRRHLSIEQRRAMIVDQLIDCPEAADTTIAKAAGASDKTVASIRREMESLSEIPTVTKRMRSDGKMYPSRIQPRSIIAKTANEAVRVREALSAISAESLPQRAIDLRKLERIGRKVRAEARAASVHELPTKVGDVEIRLGDFRDVLRDVPDESVDLILTDPPYTHKHLPLWDDLSVFAARILRPGGTLVAYSGAMYLPAVLASLSEHLTYTWTIAQLAHGSYPRLYHYKIRNMWKPVVVFRKQPSTSSGWFADVIQGRGKEKHLHEWQQREDEARRLTRRFSSAGGLIVDPFCGSGTTGAAAAALGRHYIGSDIDPASVGASRERLLRLLDEQSRTDTTRSS